ncbi:MAG: hypothetical protein L0H83_05910 [Salinisphaera sp.]|nr:hypothetical protein [Salinisphaera sp.]
MISVHKAIASALLLAVAQGALAHSNAYLATITGPHGGMVRMSGPYHFELLIHENETQVWITNHMHEPQSTTGAHGQLMVMQNDKHTVIQLTPGGDNRLRGGDSQVSPSQVLRAVLTVRMSGEPARQARFSTKTGGGHGSSPQGHGDAQHSAHAGH